MLNILNNIFQNLWFFNRLEILDFHGKKTNIIYKWKSPKWNGAPSRETMGRKKESMECVAFIFIFKTMFWHFGIMKSQHFRFGFCCYASCIWNRISKSLDKSSEKRFSFQFTLVKSCSKFLFGLGESSFTFIVEIMVEFGKKEIELGVNFHGI